MAKSKVFTDTTKDYLQKKEIEITEFDSTKGTDSVLDVCESPIEQILLIEIIDFFKNINAFLPDVVITLDAQKEFQFGRVKGRIDIAIGYHRYSTQTDLLFAIECDGHEFHHQSKEQVRNDRQRERFLMKIGYNVIRFSGSEIVNDPWGCAMDIWEIMQRKADQCYVRS